MYHLYLCDFYDFRVGSYWSFVFVRIDPLITNSFEMSVGLDIHIFRWYCFFDFLWNRKYGDYFVWSVQKTVNVNMPVKGEEPVRHSGRSRCLLAVLGA